MTNTLQKPEKPLSRIQENFLARGERHILNWICARLPAWVTPDQLTLLGLVGAVMIFAGYVASNWGASWLLLAIAGYGVQWFGDSLDGSLARWRGIERRGCRASPGSRDDPRARR